MRGSNVSTNASKRRSGFAANWFVAPAPAQGGIGSDSANGLSTTTPFATIQRAATFATAGQTVSVATGTYPLSGSAISTSTNGTSGAHITYRSEVKWGAKFTLSGNLTNSTNNFAMWNNLGNYTDIIEFEFDASGAFDLACIVFTCGIGSTVRGNKGHDMLTNLTTWNTRPGTGVNYSSGWFFDFGLNGGDACFCLDNILYNLGPSGQTSNTAGHGIYSATTNTTAKNNLIYNTAGNAITSYHNMAGFIVVNNTIYNCAIPGIDLASSTNTGAGCIVRNNIVHTAAYGMYEESTTGANNIHANNCYFNCTTAPHHQNGTVDTNLITTDPTFVTNGSDFHIQGGSGCKSTGTATSAPPADIEGTTRGSPPSRGAYE